MYGWYSSLMASFLNSGLRGPVSSPGQVTDYVFGYYLSLTCGSTSLHLLCTLNCYRNWDNLWQDELLGLYLSYFTDTVSIIFSMCKKGFTSFLVYTAWFLNLCELAGLGVRCEFYHAGLSPGERKRVHHLFIRDNIQVCIFLHNISQSISVSDMCLGDTYLEHKP